MNAMAEWGAHAIAYAREAAAGVIVIVDVLSFSTAVDVAVTRGAAVIPFHDMDIGRIEVAATAASARLAYPRDRGAGLSLSPVSLMTLAPGETVLLPSPNGSTLSLAANETGATVLCGSLRNAAAVARAAMRLANGRSIAVVAAGERWPDGNLRPAIEDLVGAGRILARLEVLGVTLTAEAALFAHSAAVPNVTADAWIKASLSGRELIARGYADDIDVALEHDASTAVPLLRDGRYGALHMPAAPPC